LRLSSQSWLEMALRVADELNNDVVFTVDENLL
jgi:hypothetical protein